MKFLTAALVATAASATLAVAADTKPSDRKAMETAAVAATAKSTFVYQADLARDGSIDVKLTNPVMHKDTGLLSVYRPNVDDVQRLIREQDWFLKVGQDGQTRGIFTVPRGGALPSSVMRSLADNESVLRVKPGSSFLKVFPDASQMTQQLEAFTATTRDTVCAMDQRPMRLTARVDVAPGWAAKGRILMEGTWDTDKLCGPVKTAAKE